MTPEQIAELVEYLKGLGELAVSKGFEISMKQVAVMATTRIIYLAVGIVAILVARFLWKASTDLIKEYAEKPKEFNESDWGDWSPADKSLAYRIVSGIVGIVSIACMADSLIKIASYLINPKWYAIQLMFGLVK